LTIDLIFCGKDTGAKFMAKRTVEREVIIKDEAVKVRAWVDGSLRDVYVKGKVVNGAKAKLFNRNGNKVSVVRGRTFQNDQAIVYFVAQS
jgi:hypothetical protein